MLAAARATIAARLAGIIDKLAPLQTCVICAAPSEGEAWGRPLCATHLREWAASLDAREAESEACYVITPKGLAALAAIATKTTAKVITIAGMIAAIAIPAPARADEAARLNLGIAAIAAVDTVQTCRFAPRGSSYPGMYEAESAWAIGKHPSCGVAAGWILGNAAIVAILPHDRIGNLLRHVFIGFAADRVLSNRRIMIEARLGR